MADYIVTNKGTGKFVYRYQADAPIEWNGMEFATHDHTEVVEPDSVVSALDPAQWRIHVGAFFDRFGEAKIPVLASENQTVQAIIKDVSVRQYIALKERRAEILSALNLLQLAGFAIDPLAILDVIPTADEVWHG